MENGNGNAKPQPVSEGKSDEQMLRAAGWDGDGVEVKTGDVKEGSKYLGPLVEKAAEVVVEGILGYQKAGQEVDLAQALFILKGKGAVFTGDGDGEGNSVMAAINGLHGAPPSPTDMMDMLQKAVRNLMLGTGNQDPFERLFSIEQVDDELAKVLGVLSEVNSRPQKGPFKRLRWRWSAQFREKELISALNDWARAYGHVEKTGELPKGDENPDPLDALTKDAFEAK